MKTKNTFFCIIAMVLLISLTSCKKLWTSVGKEFQTTDRSYYIEHYSGGKLIKTYEFKGMLNDSESSDGYYFFKGDTLIEITGDLIIKSTK